MEDSHLICRTNWSFLLTLAELHSVCLQETVTVDFVPHHVHTRALVQTRATITATFTFHMDMWVFYWDRLHKMWIPFLKKVLKVWLKGAFCLNICLPLDILCTRINWGDHLFISLDAWDHCCCKLMNRNRVFSASMWWGMFKTVIFIYYFIRNFIFSTEFPENINHWLMWQICEKSRLQSIFLDCLTDNPEHSDYYLLYFISIIWLYNYTVTLKKYLHLNTNTCKDWLEM